MKRLLCLLVALGVSASEAADDSILELSDNYFQCAAFYKGALDASLLPKGRSMLLLEKDISWATQTAAGLLVTEHEGPRRMTFAELEAMERKVVRKARAFTFDFRKDRDYAKTWIAEVFVHCDEKMALSGRP